MNREPQAGCCPECALYGLTGVSLANGTCAFGHRPLRGAPAPVAGDVPWGIAEVAEHFGVKRATVDQWRWNGDERVPEQDGTMSGRPYWWRSRITEGSTMNERTRLAGELAEAVMARLREADGAWVPHSDLLAMAPQGRRIGHAEDIPGNDITGYDSASGSARDDGPSGKPDGGMLENVLSGITRSLAGTPQRLDDGHPAGIGRALRLVTSPVLHEGDVIIIPQGMRHEGERAVLAGRILDGGPDRWRARVSAPGAGCDGEVISIARGWAEEAEVVRP